MKPTKSEIDEYRKLINWYGHIVLYLLNRTSGIPEAIIQLIHEANGQRVGKYGYVPDEKKKVTK